MIDMVEDASAGLIDDLQQRLESRAAAMFPGDVVESAGQIALIPRGRLEMKRGNSAPFFMPQVSAYLFVSDHHHRLIADDNGRLAASGLHWYRLGDHDRTNLVAGSFNQDESGGFQSFRQVCRNCGGNRDWLGSDRRFRLNGGWCCEFLSNDRSRFLCGVCSFRRDFYLCLRHWCFDRDGFHSSRCCCYRRCFNDGRSLWHGGFSDHRSFSDRCCCHHDVVRCNVGGCCRILFSDDSCVFCTFRAAFTALATPTTTATTTPAGILPTVFLWRDLRQPADVPSCCAGAFSAARSGRGSPPLATRLALLLLCVFVAGSILLAIFTPFALALLARFARFTLLTARFLLAAVTVATATTAAFAIFTRALLVTRPAPRAIGRLCLGLCGNCRRRNLDGAIAAEPRKILEMMPVSARAAGGTVAAGLSSTSGAG